MKLPPEALIAVRKVRGGQGSRAVAKAMRIPVVQIRVWLLATRKRGGRPPKIEPVPPVRLRIQVRGSMRELVLVRGLDTLEVLGRKLGYVWDLSAAPGKRRSLLRVLPGLEARVSKNIKFACGADPWDAPTRTYDSW